MILCIWVCVVPSVVSWPIRSEEVMDNWISSWLLESLVSSGNYQCMYINDCGIST